MSKISSKKNTDKRAAARTKSFENIRHEDGRGKLSAGGHQMHAPGSRNANKTGRS